MSDRRWGGTWMVEGIGCGVGGRGGWSRWGGRRGWWGEGGRGGRSRRGGRRGGWGSRAGSWQLEGGGSIGGLGVRCLGRRGVGGRNAEAILEIGFWMDGLVFVFFGVGIDVGWV